MSTDEKPKAESQRLPGRFEKVQAVICKHCPFCIAARKSPHSMVGRMLHHPLHSDNCPMWKAYQQVYGDKQPS